MKKFEVIIIGGGRASNLALTLSKNDKKVALIEKSKLGGTCPNRGCVPSKLLIGYAHVARAIKESKRHFIKSHIEDIDVETIFKETSEYVSGVDGRYEGRFNENVTLYRGEGKFLANYIIEVNGEKITAPKIVIATGTKPILAPHENAWTSDDLFPLRQKVPKSITIVGSGFIACELANFFDAVGIETKLVVRSQRLLSNEDDEISEIFKSEFTKNVDTLFDTSIKDIEYENDNFNLTLENKNKEIIKLNSEALLYAVGRESNVKSLNLETTDIKVDDRGFIKRDEFFETSVKGVFVVGDASGKHMLQHAASYEVNYLGKLFLEEENEPLKFKYMPHAVFTDPEIASVGMTEKQAKESGVEYVVSVTNWLASAKAMSLRLEYPRIKFIINSETYEILGCHMIGPESATMIHQVLSVMHVQNDIRHLKNMLYIHPAQSEAVLPAAVEVISKIQKK